MREPKPFFRKQTQSWYVRLGKQFVPLGRDEKEAFEKYHEVMAAQRREAVTGSDSVAKLLEAYWQYAQRNLAAKTVDRMKPRLKSFRAFIGPKLTVRQFRPHHVQRWLDEEYPDCSPTTANTLITLVKRVMNWAQEQGYIEHSPIAKMKKPAARVREEFVPVVEWPKLIEAASPKEFQDFIVVMLSTGARAEEMFRLEARHFDRTGKTLTLAKAESKGRKRSRVIYLPREALEIVSRMVVRHPNGLLFRNSSGNPWNKDSVADGFKRLRKKLKLKTLCATMLRHSFAHYRVTSGQEHAIVSKLMGHVDGRMLETRYGHVEVNSEFMRQQANRVEFPTAARDETPKSKTG